MSKSSIKPTLSQVMLIFLVCKAEQIPGYFRPIDGGKILFNEAVLLEHLNKPFSLDEIKPKVYKSTNNKSNCKPIIANHKDVLEKLKRVI
ncbi:hypothetical protein ACFX5K_03745 [Rickettsiales bacterium LUAb2]